MSDHKTPEESGAAMEIDASGDVTPALEATETTGTKRPPEASTEESSSSKKPAAASDVEQKPPATAAAVAAASSKSSTTQQLQQQIQQQLQAQLQAQLAAAAARGQQAHITPEQIQAQAQAMVQAAAQAQAVVAAAKSRGDGLVPMSSSQIATLSQIQAQAIVHARKSTGTPQQLQTQIQLQAQALVHAHTQAQIQAGIYKGDDSKTAGTSTAGLTPTQLEQHQELKRQHATETASVRPEKAEELEATHTKQVQEQLTRFRAENATTTPAAAAAADAAAPHPPVPSPYTSQALMSTTQSQQQQNTMSSPQFLAQLQRRLDAFWQDAFRSINSLQGQTEHDFKNHNDLPLARIKRIMKSDEDVRMISAEAPVLFAKACELFILDLSIRAFEYSQWHKRRTLQREDVKEAIQKTDIFDFLVDSIQ